MNVYHVATVTNDAISTNLLNWLMIAPSYPMPGGEFVTLAIFFFFFFFFFCPCTLSVEHAAYSGSPRLGLYRVHRACRTGCDKTAEFCYTFAYHIELYRKSEQRLNYIYWIMYHVYANAE